MTNRTEDIAHLYDELAAFARRARSLSAGLHPRLSLVAYTLLSHAAGDRDVRAADLAERTGLRYQEQPIGGMVEVFARQPLGNPKLSFSLGQEHDATV